MKTALLLIISLYRLFISPFLRPFVGHGCRYSPTCSEYAIIAIRKYGILKGLSLSLSRLMSCHPRSTRSSFDPVI